MDSYRLIAPLLARLPPEQAHRLTLRLLGLANLRQRPPTPDDPILQTEVLGFQFPNPVGLAAGFDKNAEVPAAALALGFGFVEVGSVTPLPQPGNPCPRVFRLEADRAVINRLGFNSHGMAAAARRLARFRGQARGLIGVNLGKNKESPDAAGDFAAGLATLGPFADYLAVNVSSPNTPGLRALQGRSELEALLRRLRQARDGLAAGRRPPLLLKVAPDLTSADRADIAAVALEQRLDGLIVSNTTVTRPAGLQSPARGESGGLSGRPLFALATETLAEFHRLTRGEIALIGVGGIASGADAYAKVRAGASLVQLYTALIYRGPGLVAAIKSELAALLRRDGFASLSEAVGADAGKRQSPP